jgi:ribosome-associated translation inhibitor RaiA
MCPVTDKYITNVYIDKNTSNPITIPPKLKSELNAKIRKAVRLYRQGTKIVLTMALEIEKELLNEMTICETQEQVAPVNEEQ